MVAIPPGVVRLVDEHLLDRERDLRVDHLDRSGDRKAVRADLDVDRDEDAHVAGAVAAHLDLARVDAAAGAAADHAVDP